MLVLYILIIAESPRPISRERERRTSTRLHRGIPTGTEIVRDGTRISTAPMQPGMVTNSAMRRGSASKDGDNPRAGSSRHNRKWGGFQNLYEVSINKSYQIRKCLSRLCANFNRNSDTSVEDVCVCGKWLRYSSH